MQRMQSLNDAPNTQREYETIYILRPTTANDGVAEVNSRVKGIIETMGGKVLKVDNWGKRRLAYEVAKERKGIYLYWQYLANPGVVEEFERNLRMLDSVIRYLTIKVDVDVDPNAKPGEIDDEAYNRAANTAADEEDLFLSRPNEGSRDDDEYGGYGDDDDDGDIIPGSALKDKDKDVVVPPKDEE
jgi:small subunit ribosomal protein S6